MTSAMDSIKFALVSVFLMNFVFLSVTIEAKDYSGSQVWRISTNGKSDEQIGLSHLRSDFNVSVWSHPDGFLDIFVSRNSLEAVAGFLKHKNLSFEILIHDTQKAINDEKPKLRTRMLAAGERPIDWQQYYSINDINKYLNYMQTKYPHLCKVVTIGKSAEGRPLNILRISDSATDKKVIWIDGGIHAREWISPATVTYFIEELATLWAKHPQDIRDITWYIMPVMNPDGYQYSRDVDRLWRKNRRQAGRCVGVDLNRNFGFYWGGAGTSPDSCSDIYRGPNAFSEPESQAVRDFLLGLKTTPKAYLTFHSYSQVLIYPYGYGRALPANQKELHAIGARAVQDAADATGTVYKVSPTYEFSIGAGGSDDWAKGALRADLVYTVELRDKGEYGFFLPTRLIVPTAKEAFAMVKTFANVAAKM